MTTNTDYTPRVQYGNNSIYIDFYTYLSMDESIRAKNSNQDYCAYADLGKLFGWFS